MILKIAQPETHGWDYYDGIHGLTTSGRREFPDDVRAEHVFKRFTESHNPDGWLDWDFATLRWVMPPVGSRLTTLSLIAFQWAAPNGETQVLVTSETVYLLSDDGRTVERL